MQDSFPIPDYGPDNKPDAQKYEAAMRWLGFTPQTAPRETPLPFFSTTRSLSI